MTCSTAGGRPSALPAGMVSFCRLVICLAADALMPEPDNAPPLAADSETVPTKPNTPGWRHNRLPPPCRYASGHRLPRRLPLRHDRHQGIVSGGLLPPPRARLCALRLFRARRVIGRFRVGHDRALARRCGRGYRFADRRTADPGRVEHERLDHAARRAGAAGADRRRWSGSPARPISPRSCCGPGSPRRSGARSTSSGQSRAALRIRPGRVSVHAGADRGRQKASAARTPIPLDVPVRLLHGMRDESVPWRLSLRLAERLASRDVAVTLVKDGDHRLSTPADLALLAQTLDALTGTKPA